MQFLNFTLHCFLRSSLIPGSETLWCCSPAALAWRLVCERCLSPGCAAEPQTAFSGWEWRWLRLSSLCVPWEDTGSQGPVE